MLPLFLERNCYESFIGEAGLCLVFTLVDFCVDPDSAQIKQCSLVRDLELTSSLVGRKCLLNCNIQFCVLIFQNIKLLTFTANEGGKLRSRSKCFFYQIRNDNQEESETFPNSAREVQHGDM